MISGFGGMRYDMGSVIRSQMAESEARKAHRESNEMARQVRVMAERFDKLVLLNMALWSLVQEKTGLKEEDLMRRAQEIDLQDGVADGKVTRTVKKCGKCGRTISNRHNRCLYCGSEVLSETPFDGV